ncbi:MAG: ion transporter [Xanthomonadales bacterium]|jgi:voltage-gated potassium channel|nr:ion transporter [Xanthomonadales bacterium]
MSTLRRRTAELLEAHRPDDPVGRSIDGFLVVLIIANVTAIILETVPELRLRYTAFFLGFELFSIVIFTIEYLARLWSCVEKPLDDDVSPRQSRLAWMVSPLGLIDLLAIAPFYLLLLMPDQSAEALLMLRIFRGLRLLRVFKLARYSPAMGVMSSVIRKEAPVLMVAASIILVILVFASWGIFLLERDLQPEVFGNIPQAMWWSIVTLTTVGYGDVVPLTTGGKVFAGIVSLLGIAMLALPAAIMASGFSRELHGRSKAYQRAVEMALANGHVSENEAEQLEVLREELGISSEEAVNTLIGARHARYREGHCPHCGESLSDSGTGPG